MEERYLRNFDALTPREFELLRGSRVLVAGCGGLGGYLIELLARLGVGQLTAVDGDVFEESNLNRQLLCTEYNLGTGKAKAAADRAARINSAVRVRAVEDFLTHGNADELVEGHDLAVDALDSVEARFILGAACAVCGVPMVHGAVCGWRAQVSTVLPGSDALARIYAFGAEGNKTTLSFTPALCAGLQAAECVRLLTGQPPALAGKLLLADLREMDWRVVEI